MQAHDQPFWLIDAAESCAAQGECRHAIEGLRLLAPVDEVRQRRAFMISIWESGPKRLQAVGLRKRQRPEQHSVDDGKDNCVASQAQGKG